MNVYDSVFMNSRKLNKEQFIYLFSIYCWQLKSYYWHLNYWPRQIICRASSHAFKHRENNFALSQYIYRSTLGCMFLWELLSKCCAVKSMDLSIMLRGQIIDHVFARRFPVYCACAVHAKERETKSQFHRKKIHED